MQDIPRGILGRTCRLCKCLRGRFMLRGGTGFGRLDDVSPAEQEGVLRLSSVWAKSFDRRVSSLSGDPDNRKDIRAFLAFR